MLNKNYIRKSQRAILVIAIIGGTLGLIFAWVLPSWLADLNLDKQLYLNKAGGVDFITVNLLNWAELWAPLIPATIAAVIMIHPKKFINIIPVTRKKAKAGVSALFTAAVFGITYGISWFMNELNYGMFMANYLREDESFVSFLASFAALKMPFNQELYDINTLLTWKNISIPIINTVLTAILMRLVLELIGQRIHGGYPLEFLGRIFAIFGIIMAFFYVSAPLATYDVVERTWLYIVPLVMWTFLGVGTTCLIASKLSRRAANREELTGGAFILTMIVVIAMVVVPCIVAAPGFFGRQNQWTSIVWDGKVSKEVNETRDASDLLGFNYTSIDHLTNQQSNYDLIDAVRQFDKGSSKEKLENQIDTLYETKDDTDIINFEGHEYWIAPKSFNGTIDAFYGSYNRHVSYTHTEGFVAMDAHTGELIDSSDYSSTFGVNASHPIYFGEGYRNDIILNVEGTPEVNNANFTASGGQPDGKLSGIQGWWKAIGLSFDFLPIAGKENSYLHRTNIYNRVGGMLLPYMYMDSDPYIVFDNVDHKMYYSIGLMISLPGFSYYKTNYRRFLGWVILDVSFGNMTFYKSPALNESELISFARVYVDNDIYPWQDPTAIPSWLEDQLRYPEVLYELQLNTDYTYHVMDANTWRQKKDLFERPDNGDLYFIIMDLGEGDGLEFVGVDLVKPTSGTTTLAGMYVLRLSPEHFGETKFYDVPSDT
ncbi:MAG: UPF0182 family protein, partial [Promethearchaeota archaeon]